MVLDLGGGTFDVAVLEIVAGDARLGGEDFADVLAQDLTRELVEVHAVQLEFNAGLRARVRETADLLKRSSHASKRLAPRSRNFPRHAGRRTSRSRSHLRARKSSGNRCSSESVRRSPARFATPSSRRSASMKSWWWEGPAACRASSSSSRAPSRACRRGAASRFGGRHPDHRPRHHHSSQSLRTFRHPRAARAADRSLSR